MGGDPVTENEKLKREIMDLKALLEEKDAEILNLKTKLEVAEKKAAGFQKMYAKAAMLEQRITGPRGIRSN